MIERRGRQVDAVGVHPAHGRTQQFQEGVRLVDRRALEGFLNALGTAGGAGRVEHVVACDLIGDRRFGLGVFGFLDPGAEAGQRLIRHVEQGSIRRVAEQPLDLVGAFRRRDDDFCAAVLHDVVDLVLRQVTADRGVVESGALRGPADLHERQPVLHQQRDVIACLEAQRAEQVRALIGKFVELAIGDGLAGAGHLVSDLVGIRLGVDRRMGHTKILGRFLMGFIGGLIRSGLPGGVAADGLQAVIPAKAGIHNP